MSYLLFKAKYDSSALSRYKDIHKGQKCFIIGTGPSINLEDIDKLRKFSTFGVNTLYKYFEKTGWNTSYYCIIDPNTYSNIKSDLYNNHVENIFFSVNRIRKTNSSSNYVPFLLNCESFYRVRYKGKQPICRFSDEVFDGASVVYAALQIAVYMGFKDIYLLGVDCNYTLPKEALHGGDLSYSKDYNYNWTKQTGLTMIEGFKVAKKYADEHGINIYNATRGGMLEVFPRVNLDDVVGGANE